MQLLDSKTGELVDVLTPDPPVHPDKAHFLANADRFYIVRNPTAPRRDNTLTDVIVNTARLR
jgi:hypothetical protein